MSLRTILLTLALSATAVAQARPASTVPPGTSPASWTVPTAMKTLPNGLRVVVSEDHSAPTFGLCISYHIGFRLEPQGRTGFAHLFEHMMFEGTPDAPKGTFDRVIEGGADRTMATRDGTSPSTSSRRRCLRSTPCSGSKPTA